jgi:cytoskeletal protein CcmA (bactofilin family)
MSAPVPAGGSALPRERRSGGPSSTATDANQRGQAQSGFQAGPPDDFGPVVIGPSSSFEGLLTFSGRAQVDGQLSGEILCRGSLRLGESSVVRATIEADELIIAGAFEGDANATQRIELCSTARVRGAIRAPRVSVADGGVLEGRCDMTGEEPRPSISADPV